jgi:hypothetical protein
VQKAAIEDDRRLLGGYPPGETKPSEKVRPEQQQPAGDDNEYQQQNIVRAQPCFFVSHFSYTSCKISHLLKRKRVLYGINPPERFLYSIRPSSMRTSIQGFLP